MEIIGVSGKNHYFTRVNILLIVVALIVGMAGCVPIQYKLTISSTEGGEVTTPGEGIYTYDEGRVVNLTAEAEESYRFVNWTGDVGTIGNIESATTNITMNGDYSITANFIALYDLTISSTTGGSVTTPGEGTYTYDEGTVVSLTATASPGCHFVNWSGDVHTIADIETTEITITMNASYSITANFIAGSVLEDPQGYPGNVRPEYGGTLLILHSGTPPSNIGAPWAGGGGRDILLGRFAVEKLLGMDDDFEVAPQLASAWVEDSTAKTITLTLREGVLFHDGTAFNATAAKTMLGMYAASAEPELQGVTVATPNETTVVLTYPEWNPNHLRNLTGTPGMMISPSFQATHTDEQCKLEPCGTGPYKFVSLTPSRLVYAAFEDYWQDGLPYLDCVLIDFVADETVRYNAFLAEQGDVIDELSTFHAAQLCGLGYEVVQRLVHIKGIAGDTVNPSSPFYDQRVREAIVHAIPTDSLVWSTFDGMFLATNQLSLPAPFYTAFNSSIVGYPYNQSTARSLMEAAGYNSTHRLGPVKLTYGSTIFDDWYTILQSYLEDVYIDINPVYYPGYYGYIKISWVSEPGTLVEYQFSYNGFELTYDQSLTMGLAAGQSKYVLLADPPTAWNDLYENMLAEMSLSARETMFKTLNAWAIDRYCLVMPQFGLYDLSGRQTWVHDLGYGQIASEYCPEKIFLKDKPS